MNIDLHIDRLILDGLPLERGQGSLVRAAVEAELARLLAGQGLSDRLQNGGALANVPATPMQFTPGSTPAQIGIQIARSVYGGIGNKK